MLAHVLLRVLIAAVAVLTVSHAEINIDCLKDSVNITWKVTPELVPYAARLFLGDCMPSKLSILRSGDGIAIFTYPLGDCKFRRLVKGKYIVYLNDLSYRPRSKSNPADFTHSFECVYERPDEWVPTFLIPGSGTAEGYSGLIFHMALLNEELTGVAQTNVIPLGSFIPIWAAVEQKAHQPFLLLMEECVAAAEPELQPDSQVYPIITNEGCLLDSKWGNSSFLPRYHSSAIILNLQSFKFNLGAEVYIHCKLLVWDPEDLTEQKKACHFVKETEGWTLLDDPMQNNLCSCCETTCQARVKRGVRLETHGLAQRSVVGPLIIVDHPDRRIYSVTT